MHDMHITAPAPSPWIGILGSVSFIVGMASNMTMFESTVRLLGALGAFLGGLTAFLAFGWARGKDIGAWRSRRWPRK